MIGLCYPSHGLNDSSHGEMTKKSREQGMDGGLGRPEGNFGAGPFTEVKSGGSLQETTVKATVPRVYCYLSSGSAVTVVDAGRLICITCLGAEWLTGSQL